MRRRNPRERWGALVALAAALTLLVPAPALARKTINLSASSFDFNSAPGEQGKDEVVVRNSGDEPIKVLVYAADQKLDARGKATYSVPSRDAANFMQSPATWLRIQMPATSKAVGNTPYVELKPGEKVPVKFSFEVPANVAPGDHQVVLFFEMFDFVTQSNGSVSKVTGRIGTRVKMRVAGKFVESLDVRPFTVPRFIVGENLSWRFMMRNEGNVDKRVKATVSILDGNEEEMLSKVVADDAVVYADSSRQLTGKLSPKVAPGQYRARLLVEYYREGDRPGSVPPERIIKDRMVWLAPPWLVYGAAALLGLLLLALVWGLGARSAKRRAANRRAAGGEPGASEAA